MDPQINNAFYILVVDDDQDDQFLLRSVISQIIPQAIIESLYDGSEAMAYLDHCYSLPHLIFLDLNMVKVSGKTTMELIRKNSRLSEVPVIILTTSKNELERDELLELGANAFYTKPSETKKLFQIVKEVQEKFLTKPLNAAS